MATKTRQKTLQEFEADVLNTEAELLEAQADRDGYAAQLRGVDEARSQASSVSELEDLDNKEVLIKRGYQLASNLVDGLEQKLEQAKSALEEERERLEALRVRREQEKVRRNMAAAEAALQDLKAKLDKVPKTYGNKERVYGRLQMVLRDWFPPSTLPVFGNPAGTSPLGGGSGKEGDGDAGK